jgi:hypothetical protein
MLWFLGSFIILICIALLMILTGLLISYLLSRTQAQKSTWTVSVEEIALSAFTGTAFWILLSGTLSYLSFTFIQIRLVVIPVVILIVAFLVIKWPEHRTQKPNMPKAGIVFGLALLAGSISSLPLALKNTFRLIVDPFTYVTIADFLQSHNFITQIKSDISFPYLSQVEIYQANGLRMGANFFLALITSLALNLRSVDVYPAVLGWGIALNVFGLFLWMRWGLRVPYKIVFLASFFLAVTPNAIQVSGSYGFLPQTFGTAGFFFAMAILTRVIRLSNFSLKIGALLGTSWAFLVSAYSELFPVAVIVSTLPLLFAFLRNRFKKRVGHFIKTLSVSLLVWITLSNYELFRIAKAIPIQMNVQVGWSISEDFFALWNAAISAKPLETSWSLGFSLASILLSSLCLLGFWHVLKKKQVVPLSILLVFLTMTVYFLFSKNINLRMSMWSIYKITQWSSLFFIALAFSALQNFSFLKTKISNVIIVSVCIVGIVPLISIFNHQAGQMQKLTGSKTPIQDYSQLAQLINLYNKPIAYQVSPLYALPTYLPVYFLMNRPLQGRWGDGSISLPFLANTLPEISDTLFYCLMCPFSNPRNPLLPAKAVVIEQPVIFEVESPEAYQATDTTLNFLVSENKGTCITIFSLQPGDVTMTFSTEFKKITLDSSTLRIFDHKEWDEEFTIRQNDNVTTKFPLLIGNHRICFESIKTTSVTILDLYLSKP